MASGAKTALMFMLMATMAMAAQATSHSVSCKNEYCKPITVNGVAIGVNATVDVFVDDVLKTLTCGVPDISGKVVIGTFNCPSEVTAVAIVVDLNLGISLKVLATLCTLVGSILGNLTLSLVVSPTPTLGLKRC